MTKPESLTGGCLRALIFHKRRYGGIGRLGGFRFPCQKRKGSSPFTGTRGKPIRVGCWPSDVAYHSAVSIPICGSSSVGKSRGIGKPEVIQ